LGLASEDRLGGQDFPIPFSICYGDEDWMLPVDAGHSARLI
jgi:pimeloyl-ACP methyl ester carboxylesterase